MNKKELKKAYGEGLIDEEKYKQQLFELEQAPKTKRVGRKLPVAVSMEELDLLLKNTKKKHHKVAFYLSFFCGLRVSEVTKLTRDDFDLKERKILIKQAKGGKDRITVLPKNFRVEMLKNLPGSHYSTQKSGIRSLQISFKKSCKKAGLLERKPGLKFHSLRHGFASHAVAKKIPISHIRDMLGHSNISTTNIYLTSNPSETLKSFEELF